MAIRNNDRHVLVALLNGTLAGNIYQSSSGNLRFVYDDDWRQAEDAFPLSLSMPLAAVEHGDDVITAFLWGLLPDNERTLDQYGRFFGVSSRNPVALLRHLGADCAGAVQFVAPENADEIQAVAQAGRIEWMDEHDVARELRTARERGIPGVSVGTVGQFSLAGAQPKIALVEEDGRWGRPSGRIPTTRILKPPSGEFSAFAENEHFCLELAAGLQLGAVQSRVMKFDDEIAIVVNRFDRVKRRHQYVRIHQEDICQALGVMPTRKYESEGGPGIAAIITLLRDVSTSSIEDIERFIQATALNWVIAATDAHAKNYALLLGPRGGVRLAPFYDILSYLPYADSALHEVKLAMKIGGRYLVKRVTRSSWETLAESTGLPGKDVLQNVAVVLERLPAIVDRVAGNSIEAGLNSESVEKLRTRVLARTKECAMELAREPRSALP